ncbi:MAG: hypothetical protein VX185_09525 [Pseudomonadota bacterium]|nr:hypothetical protein [Pseudomonadota bacterium]
MIPEQISRNSPQVGSSSFSAHHRTQALNLESSLIRPSSRPSPRIYTRPSQGLRRRQMSEPPTHRLSHQITTRTVPALMKGWFKQSMKLFPSLSFFFLGRFSKQVQHDFSKAKPDDAKLKALMAEPYQLLQPLNWFKSQVAEKKHISKAEAYALFEKSIVQLIDVYNISSKDIQFYMGYSPQGRKKGLNTEAGIKHLIKQLQNKNLSKAEVNAISLVLHEIKKEYLSLLSETKLKPNLIEQLGLFPHEFTGERAVTKSVQFQNPAVTKPAENSQQFKSNLVALGRHPSFDFEKVKFLDFKNILEDDKTLFSLTGLEKKWLYGQAVAAELHNVDKGVGAVVTPMPHLASRLQKPITLKSLQKKCDLVTADTYFANPKIILPDEYAVHVLQENKQSLLAPLAEAKGLYELRHKALMMKGYHSPHFAANAQELAGHIFENTQRVCALDLNDSIDQNAEKKKTSEYLSILPRSQRVNWLSMSSDALANLAKKKEAQAPKQDNMANIAKIAEKLFIGFFNAKIRAESLGQALAIHTDLGAPHELQPSELKEIILANILAAKLAKVDKVVFYQPVTQKILNEISEKLDQFLQSQKAIKSFENITSLANLIEKNIRPIN